MATASGTPFICPDAVTIAKDAIILNLGILKPGSHLPKKLWKA